MVTYMDKMPKVQVLEDGSKMWTHTFEDFEAKVYIPQDELYSDIINYGFVAPYLMIFEENKQTMEEAKQFADKSGLTKIAAEFGGSVVFFYPTNEGGWSQAPKDLFASMISQSKIHQYYQDGVAVMRDRFTKEWCGYYIRGAVLRTYLYGVGASADYIAQNCLKKIDGDGLYGKGDITPVACILEKLSVLPNPERRDIPVVSIGNSNEINDILSTSLNHVLVKDTAEYEKDFHAFVGTFRRMVGNLEKEADYEKLGMKVEPGYFEVTTSPDDLGDDMGTETHKVGYVAYYNKGIMDKGPVPLVMCFHGGGDSAMCMASLSGWSKVSNKYGFLLVCVENHLNSTATEMVELIGKLKEKYCIDSEKVYSTGFSMGGCKSWDFYQEYPNVVTAVAPMDATFEVGENVYGKKVDGINRDTVVPVFYVGGEITPLPELPFQAEKCLNRMAYVLKVNKAVTNYDVKFDEQEKWVNPIWGIDGDMVYKLRDEVRGSFLTLNLFTSDNGCCYSIFGSVSGQGHEVRHHSCENAWKFLSQFRRLPNGELIGGKVEDIKALYED